MKYRETDDDKKLRTKFVNLLEHSYLRSIGVTSGSFRGLSPFKLEMNYPITAIAGKNGSGKSSILALASCAFHNADSGFKLPRRPTSYYTFKDFYIRHKDDPKQRDVRIEYSIAFDNWKVGPSMPTGKGIGRQTRQKKASGKWNDYSTRVEKNVVYLGIERVVPHFERSQSRSYSSVFTDVPAKGWEPEVARMVGEILGKTYDKFRYVHHARYSLPVVECDGVVYSGFHMGAGESALFEIFSTIFECGDSSLFVIDEIELGLHAHAQRRLIESLKRLCKTKHIQIICTTHSREVLGKLPPDARFYIERIGGRTKLTRSISPDFAFSKMAHEHSKELSIFVEDDTAAALLSAALPAGIRTRASINIIGSASAISRQLAAAYMRKDDRSCIAVFDGDQRPLQKKNLKYARDMAENPGKDFDDWATERFHYLPGGTWPERWIMEEAKTCLGALAVGLDAAAGEIADIIEQALSAGKHSEFTEAANHLGLSRDDCLHRFAHVIAREKAEDFSGLRLAIGSLLDPA